MYNKQSKSINVTMAECGLLEENVWKNVLSEYPQELLSLIRADLVKAVPGLNEKFNRNSPYFGYWFGAGKDRVYIYIQKKKLRVDLCISRDFEEEIRREGFKVNYVNNYQGRAGWLTGWQIPHSTNNIEAVVKWLCKAFEECHIMGKSDLKLVKHCVEFLDKKEIKNFPPHTRGIYALFKYRPKSKKYDVVYIGMTAYEGTGIRGRLSSHVKQKGKRWTHFSAFEVWDNIWVEEIKELEGLLRDIYKKDTVANRLNKQRSYGKLDMVRHKTKKEKWMRF